MIITFRQSDEEVIEREQVDILFIGRCWCLYAGIVHARVEKKSVQLSRALLRTLDNGWPHSTQAVLVVTHTESIYAYLQYIY
jgi:hypothetical protein